MTSRRSQIEVGQVNADDRPGFLIVVACLFCWDKFCYAVRETFNRLPSISPCLEPTKKS